MNKQPHRKRIKHHHNPGDFHELTFSTYRRVPLLTNDIWRTELSRCINLANQTHQFSSFVHNWLEEARSPLLGKLIIRERPGKFCFRFWQEGAGFDRNLFTAKAIQGSIDYIHRNPVERKLCRRAIDFRWSSGRYYFSDPSQQQFEELPRVHGLRAEVFDPSVAR